MNYQKLTLPLVSVFLCVCASAQTPRDDPQSLRQMLTTQPDYTAIQRFAFSEGFGGFGANSKVVKMGNRQAEVTEDTIYINEPGKPLIKVFPKRKEWSELKMDGSDDFAFTPEALAKRNDTIFKSLGADTVGQYTCIKIEVSFKDQKLMGMKFLFWAAPSLRNLVVKSEASLGERVRFFTLLENVSLRVDEKLFRIPAGYKKVVEPDYLKTLEDNIRKPR